MTGRSEVKPPNLASIVSSGSEDGGWGKERMKLMRNVYTVQVCSLKTTTVKNGFDAQKYLKWAHTII